MFLVETVAGLAAILSFDEGPTGRLLLLDAASKRIDVAYWEEGPPVRPGKVTSMAAIGRARAAIAAKAEAEFAQRQAMQRRQTSRH